MFRGLSITDARIFEYNFVAAESSFDIESAKLGYATLPCRITIELQTRTTCYFGHQSETTSCVSVLPICREKIAFSRIETEDVRDIYVSLNVMHIARFNSQKSVCKIDLSMKWTVITEQIKSDKSIRSSKKS